MEKHFVTLMFLCIAIAIPTAYADSNSMPKEKVTKLHFYVHDIITGVNQSVFTIAQSNITSTSPTLFGQTSVIDDLITAGPGLDSGVLGRVQGIAAFADLNEVVFHLSLHFVFTTPEYNGSTLVMVGRNEFLRPIRRVPIIGGTGAFELARGIATSSTLSSGNHTVLEYNITVAHY